MDCYSELIGGFVRSRGRVTYVTGLPGVRRGFQLQFSAMANHSKWLADTSPDIPVSDAVRGAVTIRLEDLWHYLPLAAERPEEDIEHVHQLRVAARRASAALQIFQPLLPKRSAKWVCQELKRVRRAAGDARDFDVFIERLSANGSASGPHTGSSILDELHERRRQSQPAVVDAYQQLRLWQFGLRIELLSERVRWRGKPPEPDFGTAARQMLRPVIDEFHRASHADFSDTANLHELRICGKQLRYAMELLAGAFPKGFRKDLYPTVGEMQEKLGIVNDHATACDRLSRWAGETDDAERKSVYQRLADLEAAAIETTADEFRNWWTPQWGDDFEGRLRAMLESH